ncbi:hypothetical protein [Aurantiacibacter sediminis]|uniref:DUF2975 domain-containing protein n=1 Tax=Aurantiacibacter sediminis TaxID=2793064 RepID=A0ABS0N6H7_9SPHN|nr:hypothetical protein [Aurantiacibacter sediminis]MBH5323360.1 hypothetical protein [Aurantiacibacter sediminis]
MDDLRQAGYLVAIAGGLCALVLSAIVVIDLIGGVFYGAEFGYWALRRVATVSYIVAIIMLAFAGWQVARGRGFVDVMPQLLSGAGVLLAGGAVFEIFGVALLMRLFDIGEFRGIAYFDPTYVTLGAVGLLLWLLGRLMRRAIFMARELEEFL